MADRPDLLKCEGFTRTHDLLEHLIDDVYQGFKVLDGDKNSQYLRRSLYRAVFSFIEGTVQCLKHELRFDIQHDAIVHSIPITDKDRELLKEIRNANGKDVRILTPIDENIKKTFSLANRVWKLKDYKFDASGQKYRCLRRSKEARNRLTHPKTYYDIQITDTDMGDVALAFEFIREELERLIQCRIRSIGAAG